jgi:hypothetical protein
MSIKNITLSDISDKIILSSMNTNDNTLNDRKSSIFGTASYYLFSINKPVFAIDLANSINPLEFNPSKDSKPLST